MLRALDQGVGSGPRTYLRSLMFTKSIDELTQADIQALVDRSYREGDHLEFKQELAAVSPDSSRTAGKKARRDGLAGLTKEVVAFANSRGGWIVVGIVDSDGCASEIHRIPQVQSLVQTVENSIRDSIEPRLPSFDVRAIVWPESEDGVLVVRVPKSHLSPHRSSFDKECYQRRGESSVPMSMYEIQDFTLNANRGLARIDERFAELREDFGEKLNDVFAGEPHAAVRVSTVPSFQQREVLDLLHRSELHPRTTEFSTDNASDCLWEVLDQTPAPIVRGAEFSYSVPKHFFQAETLFCDGAVTGIDAVDDSVLPQDRIFALLATVATSTDRIRRAAGAPDSPFVVEVEVVVHGNPAQITRWGTRQRWRDAERGQVFPRYQVASPDDFPALTDRFRRDLLHFLHVLDDARSIRVHLPAVTDR